MLERASSTADAGGRGEVGAHDALEGEEGHERERAVACGWIFGDGVCLEESVIRRLPRGLRPGEDHGLEHRDRREGEEPAREVVGPASVVLCCAFGR